MADIQLELITPTARDATDQALVRRGAGPLDHTMALVPLTLVATTGAYADLTGLPSLFSGAYGDLSGIPSTFAPSAHTHPASDITDFASAVAATAAVTANTAKVTNATHTGDATGATALTLATVNANVGAFGSATQVATFTVNAKGLTTAAGNATIAIPSTAVTDFASAVAATASVTANTAKVTNATHTGDVTGATALTIASGVVTNAKLADMATATIKGRTTGGTGAPEDLTPAQARAVIGVPKITVGTTEPASPSVGDVWIDTN